MCTICLPGGSRVKLGILRRILIGFFVALCAYVITTHWEGRLGGIPVHTQVLIYIVCIVVAALHGHHNYMYIFCLTYTDLCTVGMTYKTHSYRPVA